MCEAKEAEKTEKAGPEQGRGAEKVRYAAISPLSLVFSVSSVSSASSIFSVFSASPASPTFTFAFTDPVRITLSATLNAGTSDR
jgi:hypothetical protein